MNRLMIVYRKDGSIYFRTNSVLPREETREEDYWTAQGYRVEFKEKENDSPG